MALLKKLPWLSLALLVVAYCTWGWFLYPSRSSGFDWLFAAAFAIIVAGLLTAPEKSLRSRFFTWSVSSIGRFILVLCGSALTAVVLYMANVFVHILVTISACMLARLDLQTAGFKQLTAFWVLSAFSLVGLGLGWTFHYFA
ncbi:MULTISPECIES: hypothetical protein [Trichocoleus]|uniref:Uncharacterized protein n=1 Tax=Trichocoleus desertorum GB2-A4 TaxID=2933944 RepID=A0ABV0J3I1_9CYAN|nr:MULTISPECIES: hypothetical protein [unclassified Trichocoleus]MBD1861674.1 hypothetical protein [Trichocoleus sp. FACHB-46]MBD2099219.1 hypothetical protein [Trichocoleus sp. FACHB-591]MBD2124166.1 hypothetical protein [Trichocoleus sp. FACHB-262]